MSSSFGLNSSVILTTITDSNNFCAKRSDHLFRELSVVLFPDCSLCKALYGSYLRHIFDVIFDCMYVYVGKLVTTYLLYTCIKCMYSYLTHTDTHTYTLTYVYTHICVGVCVYVCLISTDKYNIIILAFHSFQTWRRSFEFFGHLGRAVVMNHVPHTI